MRDAIVFTGLSWKALNAPERISIALVSLGCKVCIASAQGPSRDPSLQLKRADALG
jgi:hypothetical protein